MTSTQTLIGLIGRKGAGKDTAASVLLEEGFTNVKFAGALKEMLRALLAYQGADAETTERMIEGDLKEEPTPLLGGQTPRHAMQTLGTQWGRELMGADFWLGTAKGRMRLVLDAGGKVVFTDVRFPNEGEMIEADGGVLIGITADWIKPVEGEHESERLIDEMIATLPDKQKLVNRRALSDVRQAIRMFQFRFKHMLEAL